MPSTFFFIGRFFGAAAVASALARQKNEVLCGSERERLGKKEIFGLPACLPVCRGYPWQQQKASAIRVAADEKARLGGEDSSGSLSLSLSLIPFLAVKIPSSG